MGILGNFSSVLGTTTHCTGPTVVKVVQHRFIVSLSLSLSLSQSSLLLLSDVHYLQSKPTTQTLSRSPFSHFLLFHFSGRSVLLHQVRGQDGERAGLPQQPQPDLEAVQRSLLQEEDFGSNQNSGEKCYFCVSP